MTQTKSSSSAGPRKLTGRSARRHALSRGGEGGASPVGSPTTPPVLLTSSLPSGLGGLECLRGRRLELLLDAWHVVRVLEEVLQQREQSVAAEGARHQIGHVEAEHLGVREVG